MIALKQASRRRFTRGQRNSSTVSWTAIGIPGIGRCVRAATAT